jgi:hypothetical protein
VPFFDEKEVKLSRVLTDRGTEYCGNPEHHEYELYLALEDIDHSRTKTKSPPNGICEPFHKTVLDEFYRVALARAKVKNDLANLTYNMKRMLWLTTRPARHKPVKGAGLQAKQRRASKQNPAEKERQSSGPCELARQPTISPLLGGVQLRFLRIITIFLTE